jgi:hypothetical protein
MDPYARAAYDQGDPSAVTNLLADGDATTRKVTILSGQNLVRGSVIGKIDEGAVTVTPGAVVSASGGTPGNGSIGTVTSDAGAQEGTYQQVFIDSGSNVGTFEIVRPDGTVASTSSRPRLRSMARKCPTWCSRRMRTPAAGISRRLPTRPRSWSPPP